MTRKWIFFVFISLLVFADCLKNRTYGDCEYKWEHKLVWRYQVRRTRPPANRNEVNAQYGPKEVEVKCIKIESLSDGNESAKITAGGLGENFVSMKFRCKPLQNMNYKVLVYAKVIEK